MFSLTSALGREQRWWSCRRTGSRSTRPRGRSGRCARTRGRRGSPGTGAWRRAWSATRRSAGGIPVRSCTGGGTRRRRPTRAWRGGSRTPSAPTRRRSGTWTGRCGSSPGRTKGERPGPRLGFPRFKKRGRCRDSFRLTGTLRCGRGTVTLPRLGVIRTHESTRKLARRLEDGTARILSATVSRTAQRWFVSFTVEVDRAVPDRHPRPGTATGIDLGIKSLLTGADDAGRVITVPGPRPLRAGLRRLRRAARAHARKEPGSAGRRQGGRPAGPPARPGRAPARGRAAQGHQHARRPLRDDRRRGPERGRDDPQPPPRPRHRGSGVRDGAADAGLQDRLARRDAGPRGPVVPVVEEVLGLRHGESQAGPGRAHLPVRRVRPGHGPGRERRPEPAVPRRQWGGEAKRRGRDRKTAPARHDPPNPEPGTPHRGKTGTAATARRLRHERPRALNRNGLGLIASMAGALKRRGAAEVQAAGSAVTG